MKRLTLFFAAISFILILSSAPDAQAQQSGLGLGIMVGEPTGISAKAWLNDNSALAGGATWSFTGQAAFHVHADYLFHNYGAIEVDKGQLPWYYGLGARLQLSDDPNIGARIPIGLNYHIEDAPLDLFFEVAPTMDLLPAVEFDVSGGMGIRYFFQ